MLRSFSVKHQTWMRVGKPELSDVSQYYVTPRYPNAGLHRPSESFTRPQAERALQTADMMVADGRRLLAT